MRKCIIFKILIYNQFSKMNKTAIISLNINKFKDKVTAMDADFVMIEEPLQINTVNHLSEKKPASITMRTPGNDLELAIGFMYNEGILNHKNDLIRSHENFGEVDLYFSKNVQASPMDIERNFYITSSCGVCGKSSIEALQIHSEKKVINKKLSIDAIKNMYSQLKSGQSAFNETGGCHSAGLFDHAGNMIVMREDVGRHNAVDKCAGFLFQNTEIGLDEYVLCLSGRSCYELIQKGIRMNCSIIISIGAATSLAVETAREFNITLIGFYKGQTFNIYNGIERLI